jgi:dienelactone hydrolase
VDVPVSIDSAGQRLDGDLSLPDGAASLVVFAHGSGSSRHSPRNRAVAQGLQAGGQATLLLDLLSPEEEARDAAGGRTRFDVDLLARRLLDALDQMRAAPSTAALPVGLFGASTGAAAALLAAAERPQEIAAVVSRGGRPDLAGAALERVTAPVLLLVGGRDPEVLRLNREAADRLAGDVRLEVVPGATHLFPEPGALARVTQLAEAWFREHLVRGAASL